MYSILPTVGYYYIIQLELYANQSFKHLHATLALKPLLPSVFSFSTLIAVLL